MNIDPTLGHHGNDGPYVIVLGSAQDGGYPQVGCRASCCRPAWDNQQLRRNVACLGIVDPQAKQRWIIDCTPDFRQQLSMLTEASWFDNPRQLDGILLTHAHVGHYTGLANLGKEIMNTDALPVYAMPRMAQFLRDNRPWSLLVKNSNIDLRTIAHDELLELNARIRVKPMFVPHRDDDSETVAFVINGPLRRVLYLPDIDDWNLWSVSIEDLLASVDIAYLDGTFYGDDELPGRNLSMVPHPTISETVKRFADLSRVTREKIHFIHLNHTNPAIDPRSDAVTQIRKARHRVADDGDLERI